MIHPDRTAARRRKVARLRRMPLLSTRLWRRRLIVWCGALVVGLVAVLFAWAADDASLVFGVVTRRAPAAMLLIAPAGLAFSVWLTRTHFPGAGGSGIPQVMAALHMSDPDSVQRVLSLRVAGGKVLLTLIGLASGASIGREGPTVQVGSAIMQSLGGLLRLPRREAQHALVLAGGAAGISAAFNTPLAGVVFAIEELSHSFDARTSSTLLIGVIIAGITTLLLDGNYTYFGITSAVLPFGRAWIAVLTCAIAGGLCGGAFSRLLVLAAHGLPGRLGRFAHGRPVAFAACCGLALAVIGLASGNTTYGTGYAEARRLVAGQDLPASYFALKFAATVVSYVSGMPGGIFAPSLAVGAGLGHWIAHLLPEAPAGAVVLLAMVGYFAGVVQAPITAAVIVMEMTANQSMTLPLMATALLASAVSRLVCRRPLYSTLARRYLATVERQDRQASLTSNSTGHSSAPGKPPEAPASPARAPRHSDPVAQGLGSQGEP